MQRKRLGIALLIGASLERPFSLLTVTVGTLQNGRRCRVLTLDSKSQTNCTCTVYGSSEL
jgi:hypothetical protein